MQILKKLWDLVMNPNINPLKNISNLKVRHMLMQILTSCQLLKNLMKIIP